MNLKIEDLMWKVVDQADGKQVLVLTITDVRVAQFWSRRVAEGVVEAHNVALRRQFARWLEESGWTVARLATHLEVSRAAVYGWVNGEWAPSRRNLRRLVEISGGVVTGALWGKAA